MWREDAVKSIVYEAYARIRNPVYGCTVAISYLQKCVEELEDQLKATREQIFKSHEQMGQLALILDSVYLPISSMFSDGNSHDDIMMHDNPFTIPVDQCEIIQEPRIGLS